MLTFCCKTLILQQGRRQGFRPGWAKFGAKRRKIFFRLPTLVFSLPTLPYVTVAHPAHRTEAEKASLATNQEGPLRSPPLRLTYIALQLGLVIHTPGLTTGKR